MGKSENVLLMQPKPHLVAGMALEELLVVVVGVLVAHELVGVREPLAALVAHHRRLARVVHRRHVHRQLQRRGERGAALGAQPGGNAFRESTD